MPLPANGTPWPPKQLEKVTPHLRAWDAWYAGDSVRLAEHYGYIGVGRAGYPAPHAAQYRGGIIGGIARWFWGQPIHGEQLSKLHVPIAADICQAGADLLFAEPPTFTVDDEATQDRLADLADDTLHGVIAEAAEIGGALGGVYLRVTWDQTMLDQPFLTAVHADAAWPEFRWNRLTGVTFWTRLTSDDSRTVYRHLERHELDNNGIGIIQHGLYKGGENDLGMAVPLNERPETLPLAKVVTDGDTISTLTPGLDVVYVPNQRPQRRWRNDPAGASLGRSDLDGIEHMMDALDEVYSSWMRDIRLGKGRVFVGKQLLEEHGPGLGAGFNLDQEVFSPLPGLPPSFQGGGSLPIQAEQFAIRYAEHQATATQLVTDILRTAGYSSQTFGMDDTSGKASNLTATEVQSRERRSYLTRDRKIRLWRPQLAALAEKMLAVDVAVFGTKGITPELPNVSFADSVQDSQITLAQTALALRQAEAASTKTLVEMQHPDWDDQQVSAEVALIKSETAAAVPPPDAFGEPAATTTTDPTTSPDVAAGAGVQQ